MGADGNSVFDCVKVRIETFFLESEKPGKGDYGQRSRRHDAKKGGGDAAENSLASSRLAQKQDEIGGKQQQMGQGEEEEQQEVRIDHPADEADGEKVAGGKGEEEGEEEAGPQVVRGATGAGFKGERRSEDGSQRVFPARLHGEKGQRRPDKAQRLRQQVLAEAEDLQRRDAVLLADDVEFEEELREAAEEGGDEPHQVRQHLSLFVLEIALDAPNDEDGRRDLPIDVAERRHREEESVCGREIRCDISAVDLDHRGF